MKKKQYYKLNALLKDALFKEGAKWYKQQIMKDAIEVTVRNLDFKSYGHCILDLHLVDKDKVKIIIIKEDE